MGDRYSFITVSVAFFVCKNWKGRYESMNSNEKSELSNLMALRNSVPLEKKYLLSVKEACAISGIAYDTMYELLSKPNDFSIKSGKKYLIHRPRFEKFLENLTEL